MRNLQYSFIIFAILCMTSCQSQKSDVDNGTIMIDWDNTPLGNFDIKDVEYVPLETTEASLLSSISKIIFRNNCFYVLDKKSGGVYVFDRKGTFLSSIVKPGEGPEEYIELMDMDVDKEGNVYIADNVRMKILKFRTPEWELDKIFNVGRHYWEFCCLDDDCFLLKDVFGKEGTDMKLAHYNGNTHKVIPLIEKAFASVNEQDVMKCSNFNLYRSGSQLYYYERFTPNVYSISCVGELNKAYTIVSGNYISEGDLKGLEKNPMKFLKERKFVKDIIDLYENKEYFVCMPFVMPSGTFLFVPKNNVSEAKKIDLTQKPEFMGASPIEGVVDNRFFAILNTPNEIALESDERLSDRGEDANPVLMLFSLNVQN